MRKSLTILALTALAVLLPLLGSSRAPATPADAASSAASSAETAPTVDAAAEGGIRLPKPGRLTMSVHDALTARRSTRSFEARELTREQLSTLLWATCGVNRPDAASPRGGGLTAPSAFGAYAVDVMVTSKAGTFLYDPAEHALRPWPGHGSEDLRARLTSADWARKAPVLVALVSDLTRYPDQVSPARRRDYSHADAGILGQNLYVASAAMRLGTVITASAPRDAKELLGLGPDRWVVFVCPVGVPATR